MTTPITTYLREKLTEVGTTGFEQLAAKTGVKVSFIRKFYYGGRENPRVNTVQPLLDHFYAQDKRSIGFKPRAKAAIPASPTNTTTQEPSHG